MLRVDEKCRLPDPRVLQRIIGQLQSYSPQRLQKILQVMFDLDMTRSLPLVPSSPGRDFWTNWVRSECDSLDNFEANLALVLFSENEGEFTMDVDPSSLSWFLELIDSEQGLPRAHLLPETNVAEFLAEYYPDSLGRISWFVSRLKKVRSEGYTLAPLKSDVFKYFPALQTTNEAAKVTKVAQPKGRSPVAEEINRLREEARAFADWKADAEAVVQRTRAELKKERERSADLATSLRGLEVKTDQLEVDNMINRRKVRTLRRQLGLDEEEKLRVVKRVGPQKKAWSNQDYDAVWAFYNALVGDPRRLLCLLDAMPEQTSKWIKLFDRADQAMGAGDIFSQEDFEEIYQDLSEQVQTLSTVCRSVSSAQLKELQDRVLASEDADVQAALKSVMGRMRR